MTETYTTSVSSQFWVSSL